MFKRITWMGTGMAIGAGGAFWAKRKVENVMDRYVPEQVADRVATQARKVGLTVRAAASEGRQAMRDREQELRGQVDARTFVGSREGARHGAAGGERPAGSRRASRSGRPHRATSVGRRRSRR